ncbi:MAG TPA: flagellar M-ring protein FliF C-terminal domain-containing protein, partial [Steroidobacteraceae bacterium]|nr:flagellar M-ring protein FliF C-terminal domain-containing protein [Steroidobacteraceae bacterium]
MSVTEEAREQYRPDSQIVRSEQVSESSSRDGAGVQGVPGALTNQPPAAGVAQPPPSAAPPAAKPPAANGAPQSATAAAAAATSPVPGSGGAGVSDNTSKQSTRNYEIDRTVNYTRQPAGRLRRLTVAVLIDNVRTAGKDGKTVETPLSKEQLEHVDRLVKDAVGFDEARGDSVNVVNASFTQEAPPAAGDGELEKPKIWETPLFQDMAKVVAGVVVLLVLVLAVLRPMVKTLIGPVKVPLTVAMTPREPAPEPPPALPGAKEAAAANHEAQVAQARAMVTQDPKRVAQVVRGWVAQDE